MFNLGLGTEEPKPVVLFGPILCLVLVVEYGSQSTLYLIWQASEPNV